jgi:hypothetical protein
MAIVFGSSSTLTLAAFWSGTNRFYIRGVDYQPGGPSLSADPLADTTVCQRDIAQFKQLGINTIRVYAVDNSLNHDACMQALSDAGIYVAVDVTTSDFSLNNENEYTIRASYNEVFLQHVFATVEMMSKYDNTLLFFSGNEVIASNNQTWAAPYIKAVVRDIKQYLKQRNLRQVPVGYAATDLPENRLQLGQYLNCGSDAVRTDLFAINDYSWCYPSNYVQSGWQTKVQEWSSYGLPFL